MFKSATLLFLYLETPLHAGSGTSLGVVDLPIQRETHTGFPMVQASGVKGAIRAHARGVHGKEDSRISPVFGPENGAGEYASAIAFTDARILLFPVRSLAGVFAWTTCPTVLERLRRELSIVGHDDFPWDLPKPTGEQAMVTVESGVCLEQTLVLEEFSFTAQPSDAVRRVAAWLATNALPDSGDYTFWAEQLTRNLVILPDDAFRDFVELSTDVVARTRIDPDTGTVASGALWYEECLPPETLLWVMALGSDVRQSNGDHELKTATDVLQFITQTTFGTSSRMQFGGDETIGRGLVHVTCLEGR